MKKNLILIILILSVFSLNAQNPKQVVQEYVRLFNSYLSNGELASRDVLLNEVLKPNDPISYTRISCRIDDKLARRIAATDHSNSDNITPQRYVELVYTQNKSCGRCYSLEIVHLDSEQKNGQTLVAAKINFKPLGFIYNKFVIVGGGIGWIMEDFGFRMYHMLYDFYNKDFQI